MQRLDYTRLMNAKPTEYNRMTNIQGKEIVFYEHPTEGGDAPVIAVCHEAKLAYLTDFWETDDMEDPESDYSLVIEGNSFSQRYEVYWRDKDKKYIIKDWAGNHLFTDWAFNTPEEGSEFLLEQFPDDEDLQEYRVVPRES